MYFHMSLVFPISKADFPPPTTQEKLLSDETRRSRKASQGENRIRWKDANARGRTTQHVGNAIAFIAVAMENGHVGDAFQPAKQLCVNPSKENPTHENLLLRIRG